MLTASEVRAVAGPSAPRAAPTGRRGRHRSPAPGRWARVASRVTGLAAGIALAVHAVPYFAIAEGPKPLPLVVDASIVRSGEVGLVEGGLLLTGAEVDPGHEGSAHGRLSLASETSVPVDVTLQDVGSPSGLEEQIWLRVTLSDVVVFQGTQAQLRTTPSLPFRLLPGDAVPIGITVTLSAASAEAHGRDIELRLHVASPAAPG